MGMNDGWTPIDTLPMDGMMGGNLVGGMGGNQIDQQSFENQLNAQMMGGNNGNNGMMMGNNNMMGGDNNMGFNNMNGGNGGNNMGNNNMNGNSQQNQQFSPFLNNNNNNNNNSGGGFAHNGKHLPSIKDKYSCGIKFVESHDGNGRVLTGKMTRTPALEVM